MIKWNVEDFVWAVERTIEHYEGSPERDEVHNTEYCGFCAVTDAVCKRCVQLGRDGRMYCNKGITAGCVEEYALSGAAYPEYLAPRIDLLTAALEWSRGQETIYNEDFIKFVEEYENSMDLEKYEEPVRTYICDLRSED